MLGGLSLGDDLAGEPSVLRVAKDEVRTLGVEPEDGDGRARSQRGISDGQALVEYSDLRGIVRLVGVAGLAGHRPEQEGGHTQRGNNRELTRTV